jgi:hypothetical protein
MSVIAVALKTMTEAGVPFDVILATVAEMEAALAAGTAKTARQLRNQRYYETHKDRLKASEIKTVKTVSDAPKTLSDEPNETAVLSSKSLKKTPKGVQKGSPFPDDFEMSEATRKAGADLGMTDEQMLAEIEAVRDHGRKNAHVPSKCRSADWQAYVRNWFRSPIRQRAPAKPKFELSMDTEYAEMLKAYPKAEKPLGTAETATREAYARAREIATAPEILGGILGYAKEVKSRPKDRQAMVPSLGKFLDEQRWKNYSAKTATAAGIPEPFWRSQIDKFSKGGQWPNMGPNPSQPGCQAPIHLLQEFGYAPKSPKAD